ncbi:MAG: hypothetical protein ABH884_04660, partial [Candidatus Komeilibacteria bacterium]
DISPEDLPKIPFSKERLEQAKELGQYLILRADKAPDGTPLTMSAMHDLMQEKYKDVDDHKLLYAEDDEGHLKDDVWYKEEDLYTKETTRLAWSLTSKEVIPDSTNKNYLEQTELMVEYIQKHVFKDQTIPKKYQEAITEFKAKKDKIEELLDSDWEKAAKMLEDLKLTDLTRALPADVLFDNISYYLKNTDKLLETKYTWTKCRSSAGLFVHVGNADSDGTSVGRNRPAYRHAHLGVSFSCSV